MKLHAETECVLLWPVTIQLHSSFSNGVNQSPAQPKGSCGMTYAGAQTLVFCRTNPAWWSNTADEMRQMHLLNQPVHQIIISNQWWFADGWYGNTEGIFTRHLLAGEKTREGVLMCRTTSNTLSFENNICFFALFFILLELQRIKLTRPLWPALHLCSSSCESVT